MAKRIVADDAKFSAALVGKEKIVLPVAPDKKTGDALSASLHKKKYRDKDVEDEALDDQLPVIADAEQVAPDSAFAAAEQPILLAQADAAVAPASDSAATGQASLSNSGSNAGWWWLGAGVVATGAGIGVGVSGGGGGGNSGSGTTTINGTVTDGPVQGAKLYLDVNGNGIYDVGTDTAVLDANGDPVVTDASGNFSFTVTGSGAGIKLVTNGGIDTVTGEAVTLDFSAPAGYSQINPITSAIAAYMEANPGITAAQAEVAVESALGLPDLDYSTVNLADPSAGLAAQRAVAILATAAIIIEQSGTDADAFYYINANIGSGGSTDSLVTAVQNAVGPNSIAAAQLADTVAAIKAATDLAAIDNALNNTFHNDPPTFTSAATASVAENSTTVMTVAATDPDPNDQTVTYSITGGADQAKFTINSTTGALAFIGAPDFENPTDSGNNNSYEVQVTADDGNGGSTTQIVTATVTNVNEAPVITSNAGGATAALNAAENQTAVTTVTSSDVDSGDGKTFSLIGGADQALFAINATTGVLTFQSAPNFEAPADAGANNVYDVQITVTDTAGLTDVQDLAVTVTNANDAPVITSNAGGATAALNAAENQTAVTTVTSTDVDAGDGKTFSLTGGADQALFSINGTTGALTFQSAPNFESPADAGGNNIYDIQVTVTDTAGLTDVQDLAVTVTNVNEDVVVDSTGAWIDHNGNGVVDIGDTTAADFTAGIGNIDFAANPITIHFNDIPDAPLDLTGFTSDDKIEIDVPAFNEARMRTSPAQSFNSLSTGTNAVYLSLGNQDYYSVFLAPKTLPSSTDNQGVFAFYASTINYLAYWNNLSNPLGNMGNILPGVHTSLNMLVSGTNTALSALNQGAGYGELIDFIWTPATSFPETAVVVEFTGAWVDTDEDGVHDVNETTPWVGGSDNLVGQQVRIHFNNTPNQSLDLAGFGSDDLIEIDAQAFINNGHNALNILTRPNILKTDEFSVPGTLTLTSNILSNSGLGFASWYIKPSGTFTSSRVGLFNSSNSLYFTSNNGSSFAGYQLATGISSNLPLQQMVNFVNFPVPPTTVHVVVEREGAFIDYDGDGVRDNGENRLAVFSADGNADLAGITPVMIHFNDIPDNALDLTGFSSNDKIELDIQAIQQNVFSNTTPATTESIGSTGIFTDGFYYYLQSHFGNTASYMEHAIHVGESSFVTADYRGGIPFTAPFGLFMHNLPAIGASPSRTGAYLAYWTNSDNALNYPANLQPGYTGSNTAAVLATLNSNEPHAGLIDFVWTVNVVVEDQAGNVATFIDKNGNGVRDGGEDTLALIGQSQLDVDAFNALAGTSYGSQAVDLASEQVTIHYNDLPAGAWVPDLTGFGGNDRIQIDVAAMRNITMADTVSLNAQPTRTMSSQTQVYAGVSGVSSGNTAVYISGGNLKFGHRTTTPITPTSTVFNTKYTAIGTLEGVLASNAGALANHFQQVAFVTAIL